MSSTSVLQIEGLLCTCQERISRWPFFYVFGSLLKDKDGLKPIGSKVGFIIKSSTRPNAKRNVEICLCLELV